MYIVTHFFFAKSHNAQCVEDNDYFYKDAFNTFGLKQTR